VQVPEEIRCRFLGYIEASPQQSIRSAARIFGIKYSTAHAILRHIVITGIIGQSPRGGARKIKMTHAAVQAVLDWIDNEPHLTLQAISTRLQEEQQISVSKKTVAMVLNKAGFTFKLSRLIPAARNSPEVILLRKTYAQTFHQDLPLDTKDVLWVDETGINLHLRRRHGRALSGLRANLTVPTNRGRNISICGAMSEEGFIAKQVRFGAYNAAGFCEFLQTLFIRLQELGRSECRIILDNARFHHSPCVLSCVQQAGHTLHFLPPYSPMLNPIESLFGKWKSSIRTNGVAYTQETLLANINSAQETISVRDCLGWIRDVNRNLVLCLQDHSFDD
jgi:transposase